MIRALGVCGGAAADKVAAKALLKALSGDKQHSIRKHSALAMKAFTGDASKLVLKKLERAALKIKDPYVRGAVVYTIAYIGNKETTLPVLDELLERFKKSRYDVGISFVRSARRVLKGDGEFPGRSLYFLYGEDRNDPARKD